MSKYGVISGPYFPKFGLNTGRYGVGVYSVRFQTWRIWSKRSKNVSNDFNLAKKCRMGRKLPAYWEAYAKRSCSNFVFSKANQTILINFYNP